MKYETARQLAFRTLLAVAGFLVVTTQAEAQWLPLTVNQVGPVAATATYNLNWTSDPACPGCTVYDVIQGDLYALIAPGSAGDFTVATTACMANNFVGLPPISPLPIPAAGQGYFLLVRAQVAPGLGPCFSWNADWTFAPTRQCGDRDPEVNASASVCACP